MVCLMGHGRVCFPMRHGHRHLPPMVTRAPVASPVAHTVAHGGLHDPRVGMHLVWACEAARDPE